MKVPAPRSLLIEHPAVRCPFESTDEVRRSIPISSLDRLDRCRVAAQLLAATALLSDFDLWPTRRSLSRSTVEESDSGLTARIPALPVSLGRVWSRLGGGDLAVETTRNAALTSIAEFTHLDSDAFVHDGSEPGFYLDRVLARILAELPLPLDDATARSLWMWKWAVPPLPQRGDTSFFTVRDGKISRRLGAAAWAAAQRSGVDADFEFAELHSGITLVAGRGHSTSLRVVVGHFDEDVPGAIVDWNLREGGSALVIGELPNGWMADPPPLLVDSRLGAHLMVRGLSPARRLRFVDGLKGRFDPQSRSDRLWLTGAATTLFSDARPHQQGRFREIARVCGLDPRGTPLSRVAELAQVDESEINAARRAKVVTLRDDRLLLLDPTPMNVDPRHSELVEQYPDGDPRRLVHHALATGDTGQLLAWSRERLDDLGGFEVRRLLAEIAPGALGVGVQIALAEACLSLADIHGARRALDGIDEEIARPWWGWLRLLDRSPEFEVDLPRPIDTHHAPRACAEIGLVEYRRALRWERRSPEDSLTLVRQALSYLDGAAERYVEIRLTALEKPERLEDRGWRRSITDAHPELMGLVLFERSIAAARRNRLREARRLLRRLISAERSPGRLALMHVNLGGIEFDDGCHQAAQAVTLSAFRLFQAAGFQHRDKEVLYNLAVADIDQLRVKRAAARLDAVDRGTDSMFIAAERSRLALAMGELESFRSGLADLPAIEDVASQVIKEALSFLYGVEALLLHSPADAAPLLKAGGDEGEAWLDLADAVSGNRDTTGGSPLDGWGIRKAAELVRRFREGDPEVLSCYGSGEVLEVDDGLAISLFRHLVDPPAWPDRRLRGRAAAVLREGGLTGWADQIRWNRGEVDELLRGFSQMIRDGGPDQSDATRNSELLQSLGLQGLMVRSIENDRELWRIGSGRAGDGETRGAIEIIPLGSDPDGGPGWHLFVDLLDLVHPRSALGQASRHETDVRIDGVSPAVERLREEIRKIAPTRSMIIVRGETGSGKEIVARELHRLSGRQGELVAVNIAAVPSNLLEAELFGSVKGAFTGADRSRRGLVTAADRGSLFLDEVGDLDLAMQVKLLRFLESGEVRAVGSDRNRTVDVRVICATHRNLERGVREGRFREDLYYRIAMTPLEVPALRQRPEDIPILKAIFEEEAVRCNGLTPARWTAAAERLLISHRWPGNVRELKLTIESALARAAGTAVRPAHLPMVDQEPAAGGTWVHALADFKRQLLTEVLMRHGGNRTKAARELGISRQALLYQINKLDLTEL